jgi:predicted outer membrane lipoprotein
MSIPRELEQWSWVAGVLGAAFALITLLWQIHSATRRTSRKGDWEMMDRAFHGVRIGAPFVSLQNLELHQIARSGSGAIKMTKWKLDNGNEMSVTYDSVRDRILYMEIDWSEKPQGITLGMNKLQFGRSTLRQVRDIYNSNGFSYANHMMFSGEEGIATFNAFELKKTPTIVIVFVTKLSKTTERHIASLPEKLEANAISGYFKLVAVVVADERYLDEIWGSEKIYDSNSVPISLQ